MFGIVLVVEGKRCISDVRCNANIFGRSYSGYGKLGQVYSCQASQFRMMYSFLVDLSADFEYTKFQTLERLFGHTNGRKRMKLSMKWC